MPAASIPGGIIPMGGMPGTWPGTRPIGGIMLAVGKPGGMPGTPVRPPGGPAGGVAMSHVSLRAPEHPAAGGPASGS